MKDKNIKKQFTNNSHHESFLLESNSFPSNISNVNAIIPNVEEEQITNESQSNHNTNCNIISTTGKTITFQIAKTQQTISIDIRIAIKGYPNILSNINLDSEQLILPDWIEIKTLQDYFTYIKISMDPTADSKLLLNQTLNFKKLVQVANYFENDVILNQMIQSNIIQNITLDNCISLINDAYHYCQQLSNEQLKKQWGFLFLHSSKFLIKHFLEMLQCFSKLKILDKNILRDIVESYLLENIKAKIGDISISQLLNVLYYLRDVDSLFPEDMNEQLFDLIYKERKTLEDNINQNDLKGNYTSYIVDLSDFLTQYVYKGYKGSIELKRVYNKQEIIFTLIYNAEDDEVIVGLKINKCSNSYKLLSVSAIVLIKEDKEKTKRVLRLISSNSMRTSNNATTLIKISSFTKYIKCISSNNNDTYESNSLSLSITIKINLIETFILQYLIDNFSQLHKNSSIIRIPSSIVMPIMQIGLQNALLSNEHILSSIMLWLVDNSNIKDQDVINILEAINWDKIPLGKTFEFIIKFPQFLSKHSIEKSVISSIINKTNKKYLQNDNDFSASQSNEQHSFKTFMKRDTFISTLQLNIITYFFANLVECSKRIKFVQTLITLENLVNQLKNSAMVLSTAANNKSSNFLNTSTSHFIKNKTRNINHMMPITQSASIMSKSIKMKVCDIDNRIPVITDNELGFHKEIKESKHSDSKSDNIKKSTEYTNQASNKSFEAFHSQGSAKVLFQAPPTKKNISPFNNNNIQINKVKQRIVDIFFHTNAAANSKEKTVIKSQTKRSLSKIHIKSYK